MKHLFTLLALLILRLSTLTPVRAQTLDPDFQPTVLRTPYVGSLQAGVQQVVMQPDGKMLVAGGFDFANSTLVSKIMRLNADGTLDTSFNSGGSGANGFIGAMALQPDGKIIIVGGFTVYNGKPTLAQARLNANGTLDPSFSALAPTGLRQLGAVAVQPDGKVLVGGGANMVGNSASVLVRLNSDGTLDNSFNTGSSPSAGTGNTDFVRSIVVQADGKILVGGNFYATNGTVQLSALRRLNTDGSTDNSFNSMVIGGGSTVYSFAQQLDGKLVVGGSFTQINGQVVPGVARLLADGSRDNTFTPGTGPTTTSGLVSAVRSLVLLPGGNILVGGDFMQYNGVARGRVARLLPSGALDTSFAAGAGANNSVLTLAPLTSGQVLVGGAFTQYDSNSTKTGLVLLSVTGTEDASYKSPLLEGRGSLSSVVPLASGKLLVQGKFTNFNGTALTGTTGLLRRLNADGTLDQNYSTLFQKAFAIQPDGSFYNVGNVYVSSTTQYALFHALPSGELDTNFISLPLPASGVANFATAPVNDIIVQPNGRILVFGSFTTYNGTARNGIARLNADGTLDNSFVPPVSGVNVQRVVLNAVVQTSGKIVLVYQEGGTSAMSGRKLIRLNADGTLDNTFITGTGPGANDYITVLPQLDGKLLISSLTSFNGQAVPYGTIRLTVDGAVDNTFNNLTASYNLRLPLADGRILASAVTNSYGSTTLIRLNSDGSLDASFAALSTPAPIFSGDDGVPNYVQQSDGKIIAYGSFRIIAGQQRIGLARILPNIVTANRATAAAASLAVYPNPANEVLTVALPVLALHTQATLQNLTGQVVRQWMLAAQQVEVKLDLSTVAVGVYVLRIPSAAGVYQQKVIVTR